MKQYKMLIREALQSLNANKLRAALTMLGIIIGVASVVSMMGIGKGAAASITSSIESVGTNLLFITKDNRVTNPQPLTLMDAEAIRNSTLINSISEVAPTIQTSAYISYGGNSMSSDIIGVTPEYEYVRNSNLSIGSFISSQDIDERSTVAVIGVDIVDEFFNSAAEAVGKKIRIGNYLYTIIGVLAEKGGTSIGSSDNQVLMPLTTAQARIISRLGGPNEVSIISVSANSAQDVELAQTQLSNLLMSRHDISNADDADFQIFTQESMTEAATSIAGVLTIFLGGIAAISLLVGGIGIMNIMLVSVMERTREIGLRKAVGARNADILTQFLFESFLISFIGGLVGILLAWLISMVIKVIAASGTTTLNPLITWDSILLATVFSIAVGIVFGLYPANRAAKLEPVEALRME
jgi:putative ABC transport system permease protein